MAESSPASKATNLTWIYQDSRGLSQAMKDAVWRATGSRGRGGWSRDAASVADLRALIVATLASAAALGPVPPRPVVLASGTVLGVNVLTPSAREDNREIQRWLALAILPLVGQTHAEAQRFNGVTLQPATVETQDGELPSGPTRDAGAIPIVLGGIAIVSFFTVLGGVLTVYFSQRNEIDSLTVAADERVAKHAASLGTMVGLIESHQEKEQSAGTTLPWDPMVVSTLETLRASTVELAKVPTPALETTPKLGDVTKGIGDAISGVGEAAKGAVTGAGFGLGAVAAAAALLWALQQDNRRQAAA